jgi:RNA polymerase sigma-70 factor, ECF subfamily
LPTNSALNTKVSEILVKAKRGDHESIGLLLDTYRGYLLGIAVAKMDSRLRARCNASDIVQDTLLEAFRDFHQFRGGMEREFLAWIRQILANNLARAIQTHVLTDKRDLRREVTIQPALGSHPSRLERRDQWLAESDISPSSKLQKKEELDSVLNRIAKLPAHYRDVLVLRHFEELSFEEVAQRLGKSSGAVRMIWVRALESLREIH